MIQAEAQCGRVAVPTTLQLETLYSAQGSRSQTCRVAGRADAAAQWASAAGWELTVLRATHSTVRVWLPRPQEAEHVLHSPIDQLMETVDTCHSRVTHPTLHNAHPSLTYQPSNSLLTPVSCRGLASPKLSPMGVQKSMSHLRLWFDYTIPII